MTSDREMFFCPLCNGKSDYYHEDKFRRYFQCGHCALVFIEPAAILSPSEEKARYELHQNSPVDQGYRNFLSRLVQPLKNRIPTGSFGLDYGSGPGPTLSVMLEEMGYNMTVYDPFYAADESVLDSQYDFVTATEVVEHMVNPMAGLKRMWNCVRPGGTLGLMTKLVIDQKAFASWHYITDETHICFFSRETLDWVGEKLHSRPEFIDKDVIFFTKNSQG